MPGSIIGELILRPILEFIFHFVCYYLGRVIVPGFTFGRIKCDRVTAAPACQSLRWGGLFHRRDRQVYLTVEATAGVGMLLILGVGIGFLIYYLKE